LSILVLLLSGMAFSQPSANPLLQKGWAELVRDDDAAAYRTFDQALRQATQARKPNDIAESLLCLGICSFGSNLQHGLQFATRALSAYKKLEAADPEKAAIGRSKCLQLIGTIYARQGKLAESVAMSREVIRGLEGKNDASGTLGLAYSSVGKSMIETIPDSARHYYRRALDDYLKHGNIAYLPGAYVKLGELSGDRALIGKGMAIAAQTHNRQAEVTALLALAKFLQSGNDGAGRERALRRADSIARPLTDKMFEIETVSALIELEKVRKRYAEVVQLQQRLLGIKDKFYSLEREEIVRNLEVQFEVAEKNRKLAMLETERMRSELTNAILLICLMVLILAAVIGYIVLRGIHKRDRQLLAAKEDLVSALEKQKALEAEQLRQDINHKESQLSAVTLQILQKNELIDDIKSAAEKQQPLTATQLLKMVNKHLAHDASWNDFDLYFESVNRNFYTRLRERYPGIGANDLKICALIKLNLSIKEMSSILNISPDSVKTARYRLRKKLQLQTEDNLTDFILSF
jgi:hypothetical protein